MGALLTTDRYATVLAWADWHAGVVSRSELAALGIPPTVIASWLRTKRLTRIHRGVYAVGHTAIRAEGRWRAAALTCGSCTALSHHAGMLALGHWVSDHTGVHVTTPGSGQSRGELHVHRSPLADVDVTRRHGLWVTGLERTLIDLAT